MFLKKVVERNEKSPLMSSSTLFPVSMLVFEITKRDFFILSFS
jgi:hypothetical protein